MGEEHSPVGAAYSDDFAPDRACALIRFPATNISRRRCWETACDLTQFCRHLAAITPKLPFFRKNDPKSALDLPKSASDFPLSGSDLPKSKPDLPAKAFDFGKSDPDFALIVPDSGKSTRDNGRSNPELWKSKPDLPANVSDFGKSKVNEG